MDAWRIVSTVAELTAAVQAGTLAVEVRVNGQVLLTAQDAVRADHGRR